MEEVSLYSDCSEAENRELDATDGSEMSGIVLSLGTQRRCRSRKRNAR